MHETLDRALTLAEREEARRLFEDEPTKLYVRQTTDESLRIDGLEALVNEDKDIKNTIKYLEIAANKDNPGLTYAILDVDKMSRINDRYGRAVGNKILERIKYVANYVLREKADYIKKPASENPLTKGDQ